MARRRRMVSLVAGELNLTAMIDIAFQLLAFFVITVHPVDVLSNLDVSRPSEGPPGPCVGIRILIGSDGYSINEQPMGFRRVETLMTKLARVGRDQTVLIRCRTDSKHAQLVQALDLCAKLGMKDLSVVSGE
ncbi:MAG: biopolymer transporter ExbD [Planctomycetota bacterium]